MKEHHFTYIHIGRLYRSSVNLKDSASAVALSMVLLSPNLVLDFASGLVQVSLHEVKKIEIII